MAITQVNTPLAVYAATDAGFRIWGKAWTDTMGALGLTQEYSNIDWTTVTMPTTAGTWAGKRVYRFNDALSGTREVYVSLEFGRGNATLNHLGFTVRVRIGYSHSAGTISGSPIEHYLATWQTSPEDAEIIGVRTDFGIALFTNVPWSSLNCQALFLVERVGKDGAPTAEGVLFAIAGAAVNSYNSYYGTMNGQMANWNTGVVFPTCYFSGMAGMPSLTTTNVDTSYEDAVPVWQILTFGGYDPVYGMVIPPIVYPASTVFTATVNGETAKFRTLYGGGFYDSSSRLRYTFRVPS